MIEEMEREILSYAESVRRPHSMVVKVRPVKLITHMTGGVSLMTGALGRLSPAKLITVSIVDWLLFMLGLGSALASAGFAAFMITADHSHPSFNGIEHLMLFAQPLHGKPSPMLARGYAPPDGVDYVATGSIPRGQPGASNDLGRGGQAQSDETEPVIKSYVLQEAEIGVAVVESHGTAYRIRPGAFLPGAGRVISVEQRKDGWVVVTTRGIIADQSIVSQAP